ncbi:MAG: bifunctional UDP-sugar hydrolase/5'-nucleotidase [Anaerolineae bacterium]|nr:bifunctional UDP-sugar hydrolase/5'-nucleotidase [Anaerolineae bacterium]
MAANTLTLLPFPLSRGQPADRACFVLSGDATAGPVEGITAGGDLALPPRRRRGARPFRLHVLHLNDLHGRISRLEKPDASPILSRVAAALRSRQEQCRRDPGSAVLLLSAGDELAGSAFDDIAVRGISHPVYHLYSRLGMDAVVLGNHDLDLGPRRLAEAIRRHAAFPVLSANLRAGQELREVVYPAVLWVVKGVRVGVLGLTTPAQAAVWPELPIADPVQTALNLLPALRPLCDVVIVLSHLGLGLDATSASVAGAGDRELAAALPRGQVHAIVGGHTHHALNSDGLEVANIVNGVPLLQAGSLGRYLGEATFTINGAAALTDARLTPVHDLPVDDPFEAEAVQPLMAEVRSLLAQPLGRVDNHPDLTIEAVRNDFSLGESALANFICDALVERCRSYHLPVDLALVDSSVVRCGLPVGGVLTLADWFAVMPYADTIRLMPISGRDLHRLLQDNARRAGRPEEPHTERGFLHFSRHVRYLIDPSTSRRAAFASMITVDGWPLEWRMDRTFVVACPSFVRGLAAAWERRAAAELGFLPLSLSQWPMTDTGLFVRHELVSYIKAVGGVTAAAGARRDGRVRVLWSSLARLTDWDHIEASAERG